MRCHEYEIIKTEWNVERSKERKEIVKTWRKKEREIINIQ